MAAFKDHSGLRFWHRGMETVTAELGASRGQAMVSFGRLMSLEDLPDDKTISRFIREAERLGETYAAADRRRRNKGTRAAGGGWPQGRRTK